MSKAPKNGDNYNNLERTRGLVNGSVFVRLSAAATRL